MNETNSRLGLKGKIAHFESALRLLGGAHTTGAIAAGAAVNLFAQDGNVKNQILRIAVQFVFGVCTFVVSYLFWFMTVIEVDSFLTAGEDKNSQREGRKANSNSRRGLSRYRQAAE
jgi:hypothetical protein